MGCRSWLRRGRRRRGPGYGEIGPRGRRGYRHSHHGQGRQKLFPQQYQLRAQLLNLALHLMLLGLVLAQLSLQVFHPKGQIPASRDENEGNEEPSFSARALLPVLAR